MWKRQPRQQTPLLHAIWRGLIRPDAAALVQRCGFTGAGAANLRSQAAFSLALPAARQRAAPSSTPPGTLPVGAVAVAAAVPVLDLSGIEICGITRSSGRWLPGSLAFSAAVMAGLRVGMPLEAAVMGTGAEAGGDGGVAD